VEGSFAGTVGVAGDFSNNTAPLGIDLTRRAALACNLAFALHMTQDLENLGLVFSRASVSRSGRKP
jgi:hypothetical protein